MQQTETVGGTVWGELDTALTPAGDSTVRAGAAWFQVKPRLGGGVGTGGGGGPPGCGAGSAQDPLCPAGQPDAAGDGAGGLPHTTAPAVRQPGAAPQREG